jgi:hypothetical protein
VDVGGALAEARSEAGLTITQVSARTRIRETIIRDIERDDYATCGGDFYARGHIRAIARVVGTDPVPLIKEYDAARLPPAECLDPDAGTNPRLFDAGEAEFELPGRLWPRLRQSAADWTAAIAARLAGEADNHGGSGSRTAGTAGARPAPLGGITAAEAFRPAMPLQLRPRRSPRAGLLALVVLTVAGVLIYLLVSGGSPRGTAPPTPQTHPSGGASAHQAGASAHQAGTSANVAGPLRPASAAAFGPGGTGQGDDPAGARLAIDGGASTAWHTDWYATAQLGGLQSGTGLLLSLATSATITSARIVLGRAPGGTIELRAGDMPSLADLPVVARVANPGGTLTVRLTSPVQARYLLIWFTSLPPDNSGTYEASIYNVSLAGTA